MNENSNRVMFQQGFKAGQDDLKKKLLEEMPPKQKPHLGSENQDEYVAFSNGFNECREQIIQLIERI